MSSTLNWRDVTALHLNDKLIPDPNAGHNKLSQLLNVRVAIEGGFLHIDPRRTQDARTDDEYDVYIVPASSVGAIVYRGKKRSGKVASF